MPSTTTLIAEKKDEAARDIAEMARDLSMSFRDPEALARRLKDRIVARFPERVASAYWVTVSGDHDKGLSVGVYKLPLRLRLEMLWGARSGGVGVSTPAIGAGSVRYSIGAAAVAPYVNLGRWEPAAYLRISF